MNLSATVQTWMNVLLHPSEATFAQESQNPDANLSTALIWIFIAGIITAIIGYLVGRMALSAQTPIFLGTLDQIDAPPEVRAQMARLLTSGFMNAILGASTVASVIVTPIFFLIGVGVRHLVARALGGIGAYSRYAYLTATYAAPLTILRALVSFIPFLGACIGLIAVVYELVLGYYATRTEQQLSPGRSIIVVLTPLILVLAFATCIIIFVFLIALSTFQNN